MNAPRYILYGCGQVGMMCLTRFLLQWIVKFADDGGSLGASVATGGPTGAFGAAVPIPLFLGAAIGAALFAFRIFDAVTDPLAGGLSDRWVSRGGQRRSLLFFALLVPPIGLVLCFTPTIDMAPAIRWLFVGGGMFVFFVGYTFYAIPYWSLVEDYSQGDPTVRRRLSNTLGVSLLFATGTIGIVSGILVSKLGYRDSSIIFAIGSSVLMVLPYFASPPGLSDAQPSAIAAKREGPGMLRAVWSSLCNRRYFAVLLMFSGSQMSFTVMTSAAPFIAEKLLGGDEADVGLMMGPFLFTALIAAIFVPRFSRALGWEKALVVASVALGVVYAGTAGLGFSIVISPMITAMVVFAAGGPMAAVLLGLEGEAVTECARDADGESTSVYFGVYNVVVKFMNGLAVFVAGILTDLARQQVRWDLLESWFGIDTSGGNFWVRSMGLTAGGLLVIGVGLYILVRPRTKQPAS